METPDLIIANRLFIDFFITLVIVVSCGMIFVKVNKLLKLSHYHGLKYFRNAFLFFGIAFAIDFFQYWLVSTFGLAESILILFTVNSFLFNYTISVGGFYLVYSLVWKKFECWEIHAIVSHRCRTKTYILHIFGLLIAALVVLINSEYPLFIVQEIIFAAAIILIVLLYHKSRSKKRQKFLRLYAIIMLIALTGWTVNFYGYIVQGTFVEFWIYRRIITMGLFLVFLYGVTITARRK